MRIINPFPSKQEKIIELAWQIFAWSILLAVIYLFNLNVFYVAIGFVFGWFTTKYVNRKQW
jgi:hypothetical protein